MNRDGKTPVLRCRGWVPAMVLRHGVRRWRPVPEHGPGEIVARAVHREVEDPRDLHRPLDLVGGQALPPARQQVVAVSEPVRGGPAHGAGGAPDLGPHRIGARKIEARREQVNDRVGLEDGLLVGQREPARVLAGLPRAHGDQPAEAPVEDMPLERRAPAGDAIGVPALATRQACAAEPVVPQEVLGLVVPVPVEQRQRVRDRVTQQNDCVDGQRSVAELDERAERVHLEDDPIGPPVEIGRPEVHGRIDRPPSLRHTAGAREEPALGVALEVDELEELVPAPRSRGFGEVRDAPAPAGTQERHERTPDIPAPRVGGDGVENPGRPAPGHAIQEYVVLRALPVPARGTEECLPRGKDPRSLNLAAHDL
jgi:hypothetical protein